MAPAAILAQQLGRTLPSWTSLLTTLGASRGAQLP